VTHWDGHTWTQVPTPAFPSGSRPTPSYDAIRAESATSVWISGAGDREFILHWNGTSWRRFNVPAGGIMYGVMAPDGHGGVWVFQQRGHHLAHLLPTGKWVVLAALPGFNGRNIWDVSLTTIPGSRSLWATEDLGAGAGDAPSTGVILRYP
jgi:streptogramin lyase